VEAYEKEGISMWGISAANEPYYAIRSPYHALPLTPTLMRDFIKLDLGPTLKNKGYGTDKLKLLIMDDIRKYITNYTEVILADSEAANYVSGIAFHWYSNEDSQLKFLDSIYHEYPNYFLLSTEACVVTIYENKVSLGNWTRAEMYAHDILTVR